MVNPVNSEILVVGVPWNLHELATVVRDAESVGIGICVADTPQALAKVDGSVRCRRVPVAALTAEAVGAAADSLDPFTVVSVTERQLVLAAAVREGLGLAGTSSATELKVRDKFLMREALREAGLTGVGFAECPVEEVPEAVARMGLPVVVKPRSLAGSTAVHLVSEPGDVDAVREYYLEDSPMGRSVLVEEFIPGREVSFEGLAVDGRLTGFTLTDKVNTGAPNFFEMGHLMPSGVPEWYSAVIESYLQDVVKALGIETAPIHAELKIDGDRPELVEIHTRFGGGNIVKLLERTYGIRPFEAYLGALTGRRTPPLVTPSATWGIGFFTAYVGESPRWSSFDFPHPEAVVQIEFDAESRPKLETIDGVRMQRWRCGHVMFRSENPQAVRRNIDFMHETFSTGR